MNGTYGSLDDTEDLDGNDDHLSLETLDAYHRAAVGKSETAQIRRHLVLCRECGETLLDLAQFLEESPEPSRLWSAELTAAWEEWLAVVKTPVSQETLELVAK